MKFGDTLSAFASTLPPSLQAGLIDYESLKKKIKAVNDPAPGDVTAFFVALETGARRASNVFLQERRTILQRGKEERGNAKVLEENRAAVRRLREFRRLTIEGARKIVKKASKWWHLDTERTRAWLRSSVYTLPFVVMPLPDAGEAGATEWASVHALGSDSEAEVPLHAALSAAVTAHDRAGAIAALAAANEAADVPWDTSPLHVAAQQSDESSEGAVDVLSTILDAHVFPVDGADVRGRTPLAIAAAAGKAKSVSLLLAAGASVARLDETLASPLHAAAAHEGTPAAAAAVVELLLAAGADVSAVDSRGWTPLSAACSAGNQAVVRQLLAAGAAPEHVDASGLRPSHLAAKAGSFECLEVLRDAGMSLGEADQSGSRPLHYAAAAAAEQCVSLLLTHHLGTRPDEAVYLWRDGDGRTPIALAAAAGCLPVVQVLLAAAGTHDAGLSTVDADGLSPLHHAVLANSPAVLEALLAGGASPLIVEATGLVPADLAVFLGRLPLARMLRAADGTSSSGAASLATFSSSSGPGSPVPEPELFLHRPRSATPNPTPPVTPTQRPVRLRRASDDAASLAAAAARQQAPVGASNLVMSSLAEFSSLIVALDDAELSRLQGDLEAKIAAVREATRTRLRSSMPVGTP
jgi:ankyrin repeat protein